MILQESMQIGQQWGMKIGQDFANKMKKKGIKSSPGTVAVLLYHPTPKFANFNRSI